MDQCSVQNIGLFNRNTLPVRVAQRLQQLNALFSTATACYVSPTH